MGLPSKKRTSTSKKQRASHFALKSRAFVSCEACKAMILPHRACSACGYYKGKQAINTAKRATRRLKRTKKTS